MTIIKINRMTLMFIVSIATALLAITSGYLQYKEKIETSDKALKKEMELNSVYQKLEDKSNEIIQLQSELINISTGGNSFCEVKILPVAEKPTHAQILLTHHGEYPIYDLKFTITDLDILANNVKARGSNVFTLDERSWFSKDFECSTLLPSSIIAMGSLTDTYSTINKKSYNIFINAKNGLHYQVIRLFRKDSKWFAGTIIFNKDHKIEYEDIDQNIPRELFTWDFKE